MTFEKLFESIEWLASEPGPIGELFGVRIEFLLFATTLIGVAVFHKHTLKVALCGVFAVLCFRLIFVGDLHIMEHFIYGHTTDKGVRVEGEWGMLINLLGLLTGFALLAKHFEDSRLPLVMPRYLPDGVMGGVALLGVVFVMSAFLDNIAAAMIGGTIAKVVYRGRVHVGFIAALVAAANAGGAGSVVGDTTTTMLWIANVTPRQVLPAFVASGVAFCIMAFFATRKQAAYQAITRDAPQGVRVDWARLLIVFMILLGAILANVFLDFPAVGVWAAIVVGSFLRPTSWRELPAAGKGALFLICLVVSASLMPVEQLPLASTRTAFFLGFVSSVFDNIPLTRLAIQQGGYDWAMLAYSVGFGGSMVWFGSSAGVAISTSFPEARSVVNWLKGGWFIALAYVAGFLAQYIIIGWNPTLLVG